MRGKLNTPEDFWRNVDSSQPTKCWPWTAGYFPDGYGVFKMRGELWRAPRLAYALTHPDFDKRLCVLHQCDNPSCCNPAHLRSGTKGENNRDRKARNRSNPLRGEKHQNSKLCEVDVLAARAIYKTGKVSQSKLARMFGVSQGAMQEVLTRATWQHV